MEAQCEACSQKLKITEAVMGKSIRCPKCKHVMKIAAGQATQAASTNKSSNVNTKPVAKKSPAAGASVVKCPKCAVTIRLPSGSSATAFKCPKCQTTIRFKPKGSAVPKPSAAISSPVANDDPFAASAPSPPASDPFSGGFGGGFNEPVMASSTPAPAAVANSPYASPGSLSSYSAPVGAGRSSAATSGRMLGPGIMLCIQAALCMVVNLISLGVLVVILTAERPTSATTPDSSFLIAWASSIAASVIYQGVILAGSIAMIRGKSVKLQWAACVMAIIPLSGACFGLLGLLAYPVILGGGIWGIVMLWPRSHQGYAGQAATGGSQPAYASSTAAAVSYAAPAAKESTSVAKNPLLGAALVFAGVVVIGGACYLGFVLVTDMGSEDSSVRRPGKKIGGLITMVLFGFGLLGGGFQRINGSSD